MKLINKTALVKSNVFITLIYVKTPTCCKASGSHLEVFFCAIYLNDCALAELSSGKNAEISNINNNLKYVIYVFLKQRRCTHGLVVASGNLFSAVDW